MHKYRRSLSGSRDRRLKNKYSWMKENDKERTPEKIQ